ncbi:MAG: outer membrane beta-barrel protein [Planctomycetota bacterium]
MNIRIVLVVGAALFLLSKTQLQADEPRDFSDPDSNLIDIQPIGIANRILLGSLDVLPSQPGQEAVFSTDEAGTDDSEMQFQGPAQNSIQSPWELGGWLAAGYHNKATPLSSVRGDGRSFNDVPGNLNVNQLWFFVEKKLQTDSAFDWGLRADFVYGTDAQKTQAFGGTGWDNSFDNGVYGWAIPQLYMDLRVGDIDVKLGHFFTLIGYEMIPATENFFYSRSLTMFNTEVFTHTGALASYEANDRLSLYGGWVAGWDTGFEVNDGGSMFLGGFSRDISDRTNFSYFTTIGDSGARGAQAYSHSMVLNVDITDRMQYVAQSDLSSIQSTGAETVGFNQYLFYDLNDRWRWGNRVEWWKSDGISFSEYTTGLNYRPFEKLVVRSEIRYDRGPTTFDQTTYGLDAVLRF